MKKILSLVSALALSAFVFASTSVTMDFGDPTAYGYAKAANGEFTQVENGGTIAKDGVIATVAFSSGNGFRFFTHTSAGTVNLRGYIGATLTVTPPTGKKILKITATGTNLNTTYLAEGEGKIKGTSWEGEADAVVFDVIKSTVQINSMIVVYGEAGDTPPVTKVDTIGVSEAIARIKAGNKGECYVKGVVAGDPFLLGNNGPAFYMTDITNASDSLEGFKINKDANTPYADVATMAADFAMGDTILIYAAGLDKYNTIFETTGGYFCKVLGKSAATILDWVFGSAYRGEGKWTLEIAKSSVDDKNVVTFVIGNTKQDAIAGSYKLEEGSALTENGTTTDIPAGTSIKLTFKEISENSLNVYAVQASFAIAEKMYRMKADVEFFASDEQDNEIVLVGDRPFKPTPGQEITCAQAKEYGMSLASGATSDISVVVKGYVTKVVDGSTFWMDDQKGSAQTFEVFKFKSITPAGTAIAEGTEVKAIGYITNYNGTTIEIKDGAVEVVSGGTEVKTIKATVAEAIEVCQKLAQNATSTDLYEIAGYVGSIVYEYSAEYGNISFWIVESPDSNGEVLQAYRAKCDAAVADLIVPGAQVVVIGNLKNFHQDEVTGENPKPERTILEVVNGSVSVVGTGVEDVEMNIKAVKFMENGQIYIIRNGVRYNLQGQIAQ